MALIAGPAGTRLGSGCSWKCTQQKKRTDSGPQGLIEVLMDSQGAEASKGTPGEPRDLKAARRGSLVYSSLVDETCVTCSKIRRFDVLTGNPGKSQKEEPEGSRPEGRPARGI